MLGKLIEHNISTGAYKKYYLFNGKLLALREGLSSGSTYRYLVTDHPSTSSGQAWGSLNTTLNLDGTVYSDLRYTPFGKERWAINTSPTGARFTAQRLDDLLDLYNYNARYYDPAIARFISADSIVPDPVNPQSYNRFAYVLNSPLNYTDPTGHRWLEFDSGGGSLNVDDAAAIFAAYLLSIGLRNAQGIQDDVLDDLDVYDDFVDTLDFDSPLSSPDPDSEPEPEPEPQGLGPDVLIEPTSQPKRAYVADSNIFMDNVTPQMEQWRNSFLSDPNVIIYVPVAADSEINWASPTEVARRLGVSGGAIIQSVPNGDISNINVPAGRHFDKNDMKILQTAADLNLPLLTLNKSMINQVHSYPARNAIWGHVAILTYQ